jgi:hypothetical protein
MLDLINSLEDEKRDFLKEFKAVRRDIKNLKLRVRDYKIDKCDNTAKSF